MKKKQVNWPVRVPPDSGKRRTLLLFLVFLVPVAIITVVTYRSTVVETGLVENSLHRQAEMVSRGIEASLNVGMMHSAWTPEILQDLLDANASQSGARLIFLSSPSGIIATSSGPLDLEKLPEELSLSPGGNQTEEGGVFLEDPDLYVFRRALKSRPDRERGDLGVGGMMGMHRALAILPDDLFITVVLDAAGTSYLKAHHLRMNLMTAFFLTISIAGIAGWGFWSQKARETAVTLARTQSYAEEIVTRMPAGLILCNDEGRISMTNPGAEKMLGTSGGQMKGVAVSDIFPEQLLPCDSLRKGVPHPLTEGVVKVKDRERTISLSATPIPGGNDGPDWFLILFQDITELESLRDKLARAERLAEIGELSSTVAHEIRNPLSSIRGLAQLLSGKIPEEQGAMMKTLVQEVDRLNGVVSGLLSYARQENLTLKEWDVGSVLEHVRILAEGDARLKGVNLEIDVINEEIVWSFDRDLIIQALLNMVMNAIEASPPRRTVALSVAVEGGNLFFSVTDQGEGVPADNEKLFSLFVTTKERGTGLGLPLVRKVAQLHGGGASLGRGEDRGTVARIWIPWRAQG